MAKLGNYAQSANDTVECPINLFLENIKGKLGTWNKEKKENDFYQLDNFIILNVWYTIKGQVWDDSIKKYTATYFSNEVHSFNETFYAIEMTFSDGKAFKKLSAKWLWNDREEPSESVKPKMPAWIWLKVWVTVLDLDDWLVKELFIWISDFINNIQPVLKEANPNNKYKFEIAKAYTNGTKVDGKEVFITEAELDKLKWSEAAQYKNRYVSTLTVLSVASDDEVATAESKLDLLDAYLVSKKSYYKRTYGDWAESKEDKYAKPAWVQSDEDFAKEVKAEEPIVKAKWETDKHNSSDDISISDIPF